MRSLKLIQWRNHSISHRQREVAENKSLNGRKMDRSPCSSRTASSSPSKMTVYRMARSRSYSVNRAPGVSRCSPFCTANIPLEAEYRVVTAAKEATKVVDWALRLYSTSRMVS